MPVSAGVFVMAGLMVVGSVGLDGFICRALSQSRPS